MNRAFTIRSILDWCLIKESPDISDKLVRYALNNLVEKEKIHEEQKDDEIFYYI